MPFYCKHCHKSHSRMEDCPKLRRVARRQVSVRRVVESTSTRSSKPRGTPPHSSTRRLDKSQRTLRTIGKKTPERSKTHTSLLAPKKPPDEPEPSKKSSSTLAKRGTPTTRKSSFKPKKPTLDKSVLASVKRTGSSDGKLGKDKSSPPEKKPHSKKKKVPVKELEKLVAKIISDLPKTLGELKGVELKAEQLNLALTQAGDLPDKQKAIVTEIVMDLAVSHEVPTDKLEALPESQYDLDIDQHQMNELIAAYRADLRDTNAWGGWMEAEAAAQYLNIAVVVYAPGNDVDGAPIRITTLNRGDPAPGSGLSLWYDGVHFQAYNADTGDLTDNLGGGHCLYLALLDVAGQNHDQLATLRQNTEQRITDHQIATAIRLMPYEGNLAVAMGKNLAKKLLGDEEFHVFEDPLDDIKSMKDTGKSDKKKRLPLKAPSGTRYKPLYKTKSIHGDSNVLGPYKGTRVASRLTTCKVKLPDGSIHELNLVEEERKALILENPKDGIYRPPEEWVRTATDSDPTWAALCKPKSEPAARFGIELQFNHNTTGVVSLGTGLDAVANGHLPVWGSRLQLREGPDENWRDAFHLSLDGLLDGAVIEVVTTHVCGRNLQAYLDEVAPIIAKALTLMGQVNPYLYRTGKMTRHSYDELELHFKGQNFKRSLAKAKSGIVLGQATTTLTVDELKDLQVDLKLTSRDAVHERMRQQAQYFRIAHKKRNYALIKNALEQFTNPGYLEPGTRVHKNPVLVEKGVKLEKGSKLGKGSKKERVPKYLTFGGNKVGNRFDRTKMTPAYLIEFREGTTIGPGLAKVLARAILGESGIDVTAKLREFGLPVQWFSPPKRSKSKSTAPKSSKSTAPKSSKSTVPKSSKPKRKSPNSTLEWQTL